METSVLQNLDTSEPQNSDCKSDPGPSGSDPSGFYRDMTYLSDTQVLNDATSPSTGKQIAYQGIRDTIRDGLGFEDEYSNLCKDP